MISECIKWKIDQYMNHFIIPFFPPEKIHWFFSLSGGKDSFVMVDAIYNWYKRCNINITATGFHVIQWDNGKKEIEQRFGWMENLLFFDARKSTEQMYKLSESKSLLCSNCSSIRKTCSDMYFSTLNSSMRSDMTNILCRGLHLTDTANSLLWRLLWQDNPVSSIIEKGKGKPITRLFSNLYLAKPLCFVREYESQCYANKHNYTAYQCSCPALRYPCRRDIIEESVSLFYSSPLWEFSVPGIQIFFSEVLNCKLETILKYSLPGKETKQMSLPQDFFEHTVQYFQSLTKRNEKILLKNTLDVEERIEDYMPSFLLKNQRHYTKNINFKLLTAPECLTNFDKRMISTLGPMWGTFSLPNALKKHALQLQEEIYHLRLDSAWSQVHSLLNLYYKEQC